ncbi:hypothetical protein [Haliangium sp.]|uniref:hypothetical protein n=1 Tax=Haliangium sp. TaxID=2663208 RepID=UPI003D0C22EB
MKPRPQMLKVLCPVEGKNGKTHWIRVGNAFVNRDGSTNVYLNAYPTSGKLQIRELDERAPPQDDLHLAPPAVNGAAPSSAEDLPF